MELVWYLFNYCFDSNRRTLLNRGIAISSNYWNEKTLKISGSLPTVFGIAADLNKKIRNLIRKVEDIIHVGLVINDFARTIGMQKSQGLFLSSL